MRILAGRRQFTAGLAGSLASFGAAQSLAAGSGAAANAGHARRELVYSNALSTPADIAAWRLEGEAQVSFPAGAMRIENTRSPDEGQSANIVFWSDVFMSGAVDIEWEFRPLREPGLCVLLMFAQGLEGRDLFSPDLAPRNGIYKQYINGEISNIGLSYFRRRMPSERAFHLCNLRSNPGFDLIAQAADPLPPVADWPADRFYSMRLRKTDTSVHFFIEDFPVLDCTQDFSAHASGYLGFRQMAPLIAEYRNLMIHRLV